MMGNTPWVKTLNKYLKESSLPVLSKERIVWWNKLSKKAQEEHVKRHPDADVSVLVHAGKLITGQKVGGDGEPQGEPEIPFDDLSDVEKEKAQKEIDKKNQSTAKVPTAPHKLAEKVPPTAEEKRESRIKKIAEIVPLGKNDPVIDLLERIERKTIKDTINPLKSTVFTSKHVIQDKEWSKKNKEHQAERPQSLGVFMSGTKYPKSVAETVQRMFNTEHNDTTKSILHFVPKAGKGEIHSQCGEMMSVMVSTMDDDEIKLLKKEMSDAFMKRGEGDWILTPDWFNAALKNREAMHDMLRSSFPGMDIPKDIESTVWDDEDQLKAVGVEDRSVLEPTSDMFMVVKDKKGERTLVEFSLKKDAKVRFKEAGISQLIPKEHEHSHTKYMEKQDGVLKNHFTPEHQTKMVRVYEELNNRFRDVTPPKKRGKDKASVELYKSEMKSFLQINQHYEEYKTLKKLVEKGKDKNIGTLMTGSGDESRQVKMLLLSIQAREGSPEAKQAKDDIESYHTKWSNSATMALAKDPECKKRLVKYIDDNMPLRGLCEGVENMCIGGVGINKKVFAEMFGVSKWEQVTENFVVRETGGKYHLVYAAKGKTEIPVCKLNVRQHGIGHSSAIGMEMTMLPDFYKAVEGAANAMFGDGRLDASYVLPGVTMKINENIFMRKYLFQHK